MHVFLLRTALFKDAKIYAFLSPSVRCQSIAQVCVGNIWHSWLLPLIWKFSRFSKSSSSSLGIPSQSPLLVSPLLLDLIALKGPWAFSSGLFLTHFLGDLTQFPGLRIIHEQTAKCVFPAQTSLLNFRPSSNCPPDASNLTSPNSNSHSSFFFFQVEMKTILPFKVCSTCTLHCLRWWYLYF